MEVLTNSNYYDYLLKYYQNPNFFSEEEFEEDLLRVKYIKKLLTRYIENGEKELRERLILNHIIILNNIFGPELTVRILFLKLEYSYLKYIKPFLIMINILPRYVINVERECVIDTNEIEMDQIIIQKLRQL